LVLETVESAPPTNAFAVAAFGCHIYANQLTLTMNYHREHFDSSEATRFMATVVERLQNSVTSD